MNQEKSGNPDMNLLFAHLSDQDNGKRLTVHVIVSSFSIKNMHLVLYYYSSSNLYVSRFTYVDKLCTDCV
jgi:hypothetical protein